jgi:hypothetical protein
VQNAEIAYIAAKKIKKNQFPKTLLYPVFRGAKGLKSPILLQKK